MRNPEDVGLFYPCANCHRMWGDHLNERCLFGPGTWQALDMSNLTNGQWDAGKDEIARVKVDAETALQVVRAEQRNAEALLDTLSRTAMKMARLCKHLGPDGQSTVVSGFMMSSCTRCGWNDY